jgi:hypothetical protein
MLNDEGRTMLNDNVENLAAISNGINAPTPIANAENSAGVLLAEPIGKGYEQPKVAQYALGLKLDFGSGDNPKPGFDGVDFFAPKAKWKQNLFEFPWPWGDGQVAEINCSHFIEHIPMAYVDKKENVAFIPTENSVDLLVRFFDECYRILMPGGKMTVFWPNHRNDRAFQDPTHRRFIPPTMVLYLNKNWRVACGLSHYLGNCNFTDGSGNVAIVNPIGTNPEFQMYSQEAAMRRMNESWNVIADWQAILIKEIPPVL